MAIIDIKVVPLGRSHMALCSTTFLLALTLLSIKLCLSNAYALHERHPPLPNDEGPLVLFNFNQQDDVADWVEISDTTRSVGKSKAVMTIVESEAVRRAIFFALLNPQPDGACFAGMRKFYDAPQDWSEYVYIVLNKARNQGENTQYKFVVQDNSSLSNSSLVFEGFFDTSSFPEDEDGFVFVTYPLDKLICSYHGKICDLDVNTRQILSVGLQIAGGVYIDDMDQYGPATLGKYSILMSIQLITFL